MERRGGRARPHTHFVGLSSLAPPVLLHVGMRLAALLFFATSMVVVAACASEAGSNKQPLPVCDEGSSKCPNVPKAGKKNPDPSDGPTGSPTPAPNNDELPPPTPPPDAGPTKDADAPLGNLCKALSKCCGDLEAAGYSPKTCQEIVDLKNENACHAQHQQYKQFGECS